MALLEYGFYENKYGGSAVDDESFKTMNRRAESFLNRITFNRIVSVDGQPGQMIDDKFEAFTNEELEILKFGLCAVIDAMGNLSKAQQQALSGNSDNGNVKSRSSGGESISYERQKTVYDDALMDDTKKNALFRNALMGYVQPGAFRHNPFYAGWR